MNGQLALGSTGLARHFGHVVVAPYGPTCGCGRRGCLEALASGTAIARERQYILGAGTAARQVFEAADAGNFDCITMLKRATDYLASAIADAVALLDLDLVVIGGGVGMSPSFVRRLSSSLARMPAGFVRPVVTARLGSDAGLIGAALLAREPALP